MTIFFAAGQGQCARWWISHGWKGESQTLQCAADTDLPPKHGWADLEGNSAPAGFTVSASEDGRAVNVLIERSRAAKPQGTPGAGQVELPHAGGVAEKQSQDGSAVKQPPSAGSAPSDSQVAPGRAQEEKKGNEDAAAVHKKADGAQPSNDLSSAEQGTGDGEADMELSTAELDNWVIDRRPPDVPEEVWRDMPRAKQEELFKNWTMKFPEEGDLFDQKIIAWFE